MYDDGVLRRFWAKVDKRGAGDCWEWTGAKIACGYGVLHTERPWKHEYAHRISWKLAHEEQIPDGMFVCHSCDHPSCVNPSHLWVGTAKDNMHDMVVKGRANNDAKCGIRCLSKSQIEEIVAATPKQGKTLRELGSEYGCSHETIRKLLLGRTRRSRMTEQQIQNIKEDHAKYVEWGRQRNTLAEKYGVSVATISRVLSLDKDCRVANRRDDFDVLRKDAQNWRAHGHS